MKVVRKFSSSDSYTILDESPKYYIVRDSTGHSIALDKQEWGPVQEWVDVTHGSTIHTFSGFVTPSNVSWNGTGYIQSQDGDNIFHEAYWNKKYKLVLKEGGWHIYKNTEVK